MSSCPLYKIKRRELVLAYFINQLISHIFAYYLPEKGAVAIFIPTLIFSFCLLTGYAIVGYIFKISAKK
ncbi:hypothetical protein DXF96_11110 [Heyndrickxia coagulans]|uniref:Uncharacterized protein n=1 Tax=Heyndrickxia coagulans TaxID=1398 RepID=A0A133KDI6_HEYCO|nr:hypothetical protein CYJ15_05560 [Heyndrickxia coagulans]KWZ77638.1 hypothetical protein HMPREF3213_03241 [Heyndrickxia coagulans]QDI61983.1 hypothetical protein DXF96_11110 [Heyndrickxia coagulans]